MLWLNGSVALIPELPRPPVTAQYPLLPSLCPENVHFHKSFVRERGDRRCQRAHGREQCWLAHQQQPLKAHPRWHPHTQRRHEFASGSRSWHDFFKVHHTSMKNVWRKKKKGKTLAKGLLRLFCVCRRILIPEEKIRFCCLSLSCSLSASCVEKKRTKHWYFIWSPKLHFNWTATTNALFSPRRHLCLIRCHAVCSY